MSDREERLEAAVRAYKDKPDLDTTSLGLTWLRTPLERVVVALESMAVPQKVFVVCTDYEGGQAVFSSLEKAKTWATSVGYGDCVEEWEIDPDNWVSGLPELWSRDGR